MSIAPLPSLSVSSTHSMTRRIQRRRVDHCHASIVRRSEAVPTAREPREDALQLVGREVHVLDDAAIELR